MDLLKVFASFYDSTFNEEDMDILTPGLTQSKVQGLGNVREVVDFQPFLSFLECQTLQLLFTCVFGASTRSCGWSWGPLTSNYLYNFTHWLSHVRHSPGFLLVLSVVFPSKSSFAKSEV